MIHTFLLLLAYLQSGNPISISDFYGTANTVTFSYEIIGGGVGGGYGLEDGYGSTARAAVVV